MQGRMLQLNYKPWEMILVERRMKLGVVVDGWGNEFNKN